MLNIHLKPKKRKGLSVKEIAVFAMLGAIMCISVEVMEALPNVHLIGAFIVAITVVYRAKALYPIYLFVFLTGLINGFGMWWITYLYIWAVLWAFWAYQGFWWDYRQSIGVCHSSIYKNRAGKRPFEHGCEHHFRRWFRNFCDALGVLLLWKPENPELLNG